MFDGMALDTLTVLAEPTRRRIVERLRVRESSVAELVAELRMSQPAVSKHLRVLRDAGVVSARPAAQQRIYRLEPGPFQERDAWLRPYRELWAEHLGRLEQHLNRNP
jgi:DNA-binding transcriptional ArsR family regulator